ncbi:MAG: PadR family transcriptional regulator [Cyanobacteriota bacterium]|nr:PadR family transcriptional regulator [Cyanobacteriota bacterium]
MALAHALMASLIEEPCSGYDLSKRFGGSVGFFWNASQQQIYRELTKLEEQGWISSETIPQQGRPDKKLFSVTNWGQKQLTDWITQPCEPTPIKDELLVKVFVGYLVPRPILLEELRRHRETHLKKLSIYQDIQGQYFSPSQQLSVKDKFVYLTLRRGIRMETDAIAWCDEAIALLSQLEELELNPSK